MRGTENCILRKGEAFASEIWKGSHFRMTREKKIEHFNPCPAKFPSQAVPISKKRAQTLTLWPPCRRHVSFHGPPGPEHTAPSDYLPRWYGRGNSWFCCFFGAVVAWPTGLHGSVDSPARLPHEGGFTMRGVAPRFGNSGPFQESVAFFAGRSIFLIWPDLSHPVVCLLKQMSAPFWRGESLESSRALFVVGRLRWAESGVHPSGGQSTSAGWLFFLLSLPVRADRVANTDEAGRVRW